MAESSKIGWTDHTFNPWTGCQKVSPGCDHCYAESWAKRSGVVQWGPDAQRRRTTEKVWRQPLEWNSRADAFMSQHGRRQRVFCASLSDVFDNAAPIEWFIDLLRWIHQTPRLDWLLLTKRIGNAHDRLKMALDHLEAGLAWESPGLIDWLAAWASGYAPPANVWIGATIVTREEMLRDARKLAKVPAVLRFWSCEPLLEDLGRVPASTLPDWIIAGFESGPGFRPGEEAWLHSLRDEAIAGGVPLFVKQLGGWPNKRDALEDLPETLRVRQWPNV